MDENYDQRIRKLEQEVERLKEQVKKLTEKTDIGRITEEVNRRLGRQLHGRF